MEKYLSLPTSAYFAKCPADSAILTSFSEPVSTVGVYTNAG